MGFHLVSSVVSHQMISLEYYWVLPSFVGIQRRWRTWASGCSLMRNFLRLKDNLRTLAHEKVLILAKFWKTSTPTLATARFNGTPSGSCDRPMSIGFTPGSSQLVRFRRLFTGFFFTGFRWAFRFDKTVESFSLFIGCLQDSTGFSWIFIMVSRVYDRFYSTFYWLLVGFTRVLLGIIGLYWVCTVFKCVKLWFTVFNWVPLGFTGFKSVSLCFTVFLLGLLGFTGVLLGFYWILWDFTVLY